MANPSPSKSASKWTSGCISHSFTKRLIRDGLIRVTRQRASGLLLKLSPEFADDDSDDCAADSAHADDRPIGFGDDRIWDAQQQAEAKSDCPSGPRQACRADDESNSKACNESRYEGILFIWEAHR